MDFFNGHFIWLLIEKNLRNVFAKTLGNILSQMGKRITEKWQNTPIMRRIFVRCTNFLGSIFYYAMGICILLLLIIGSREAYYIYSHYNNAATDQSISITLANQHVILIQTNSCADASYIDMNADSIQNEINNAGNANCNGWTIINVPPGFPPVYTRLPDGTTVYLNTGSTLFFKICAATEKREVRIQGEAFFDVASAAHKIFNVYSKDLMITVIGTSFNINNYQDNDKAEVSVLNGNILLTANRNTRGVQAGQTATLNRRSGSLNIASFDKRLMLTWRKGIYFFEGERLEDICKVASRMYGKSIIIDSKQSANSHFSGMINRNLSLEEFLSYIKDTGNVESYLDGQGRIHLR